MIPIWFSAQLWQMSPPLKGAQACHLKSERSHDISFALYCLNGIRLNQDRNASDKGVWPYHVSRVALEERFARQVSQNAKYWIFVLFALYCLSCLLSLSFAVQVSFRSTRRMKSIVVIIDRYFTIAVPFPLLCAHVYALPLFHD